MLNLPGAANENPSGLHRRHALATAGLFSLAALASTKAHAAPPQGERTYEGESAAGNIQEALDAALAKVSGDLAEGNVSDAMANWKIIEVTGQLGGIAALRTAKVTISATRTPPWLNAPGK
jgi:hypothetical protein